MRILKYFFVGGTAAIIDVGLFLIFTKFFDYNYLAVGFFSFILATFVNYYLSIKFVFESGKRFKKSHEIILIYIVSGTSLVLNLILLYLIHDKLNVEVGISKIIVTGILFFYNYLIRRFFVFHK